MRVHIKYYGLISELVDKESESLDTTTKMLTEVVHTLQTKYPGLSEKVYKIAVNNEFVEGETELADNATIDLLPPFSGG